jgi:hypothetical protein
MEHAHERKHNSHCTKGQIRNNPDIDTCRWIVGNLSRRPLTEGIRVEQVLWECYAFDWDILEEIHFESDNNYPITIKSYEGLYAPFLQFWNAWVSDPWKSHDRCRAHGLQETMHVFL